MILAEIRAQFAEAKEDEDRVKLWNRVCFRLDVMAMIVGQLLNAAMLIWWVSLHIMADNGTIEDYYLADGDLSTYH